MAKPVSSSRSRPASRRSPPSISHAEWSVMEVLWRQSPLTANQVVEALAPSTHWKPKTIHTLLRRLAQKGAVAVDKPGREHSFRPAVAAPPARHAATRSFLKRLFNGDLAPLLANFLEHESLSPEELEELKRILDQNKS